MQYDEYYRPIIVNPYRERVRIVYIYDNAPRIVWISPLANSHLQATGRDQRGRKQYRYHARGAKSATRRSTASC